MNVKEYLTSKKYGSLRYKLSYFFHSKILSFLLAGTSIVIHGITGGKPENTLNVPRPTFYLERTFGHLDFP